MQLNQYSTEQLLHIIQGALQEKQEFKNAYNNYLNAMQYLDQMDFNTGYYGGTFSNPQNYSLQRLQDLIGEIDNFDSNVFFRFMDKKRENQQCLFQAHLNLINKDFSRFQLFKSFFMKGRKLRDIFIAVIVAFFLLLKQSFFQRVIFGTIYLVIVIGFYFNGFASQRYLKFIDCYKHKYGKLNDIETFLITIEENEQSKRDYDEAVQPFVENDKQFSKAYNAYRSTQTNTLFIQSNPESDNQAKDAIIRLFDINKYFFHSNQSKLSQIPENYQKGNRLFFIYNYLKNGRARNWADAVNLLHQEENQAKRDEQTRQFQQEIMEYQEELAWQQEEFQRKEREERRDAERDQLILTAAMWWDLKRQKKD